MLGHLLLVAASVGAAAAEYDSLAVRVECSPRELQLCDVVFVRISMENTGRKAIVVPSRFPRELGFCRFELIDPKERTRFDFLVDGMACGGVPNTILAPGKTLVILYDFLPVPRFDRIGCRFWDPEKWRRDSYELRAYLRLGKRIYREVFGPEIRIAGRAEHEIAALRKLYGGGRQRKPPRDWDWDQPTLGLFGLSTFPLDTSTAENLAALQRTLSPGSLQDLVRVTQLTQAVYKVHEMRQRRAAAARLVAWLDDRPEIERHWIAMRLYNWCWHNRRLGVFAYEFVDHVICRLPEQYGGNQDYQQSMRTEYLLDHAEAQKYWKKATTARSVSDHGS
ncbi:MAG TPA: hypothetical protein EYP56_18815 [Planctomycetaceae bacterium]|nr:hypothetical protein [Planctomycetaceae bacterium]